MKNTPFSWARFQVPPTYLLTLPYWEDLTRAGLPSLAVAGDTGP